MQSQERSEKCWRAALELDLTSYRGSVSFSMYFNRSWRRPFCSFCFTCLEEIMLPVKLFMGCVKCLLSQCWPRDDKICLNKLGVLIELELNLHPYSVWSYPTVIQNWHSWSCHGPRKSSALLCSSHLAIFNEICHFKAFSSYYPE